LYWFGANGGAPTKVDTERTLKGFQTWIKERMTDQTIEFKEVDFTEPEPKAKKAKGEGKGEKETMT
jgi:hypothetical protein